MVINILLLFFIARLTSWRTRRSRKCTQRSTNSERSAKSSTPKACFAMNTWRGWSLVQRISQKMLKIQSLKAQENRQGPMLSVQDCEIQSFSRARTLSSWYFYFALHFKHSLVAIIASVSHSDWPDKTTFRAPFQPIRSKTNTDRDGLAHIFPRFAPVTCICFKFWLLRWIVVVHWDWSQWLLLFWFYDTLLTIALFRCLIWFQRHYSHRAIN